MRDSNDNVLYVVREENVEDIYYTFHLTYSEHNANGFLKYREFKCITDVKEYIEQTFISEYF